MSRHGIKSKRWNTREKQLITDFYPGLGGVAMREKHLPYRSVVAINSMASKMGVSITEETHRRLAKKGGTTKYLNRIARWKENMPKQEAFLMLPPTSTSKNYEFV